MATPAHAAARSQTRAPTPAAPDARLYALLLQLAAHHHDVADVPAEAGCGAARASDSRAQPKADLKRVSAELSPLSAMRIVRA